MSETSIQGSGIRLGPDHGNQETSRGAVETSSANGEKTSSAEIYATAFSEAVDILARQNQEVLQQIIDSLKAKDAGDKISKAKISLALEILRRKSPDADDGKFSREEASDLQPHIKSLEGQSDYIMNKSVEKDEEMKPLSRP